MIQVKTPIWEPATASGGSTPEHGTGAYLGGTNETDRSARACVHVALAARPDQMLAKPGMGVDEGLMIVFNEMQRALRLLEHKLNRKQV